MSPISVPHDRQIQFLAAMQQENAGLVVDGKHSRTQPRLS